MDSTGRPSHTVISRNRTMFTKSKSRLDCLESVCIVCGTEVSRLGWPLQHELWTRESCHVSTPLVDFWCGMLKSILVVPVVVPVVEGCYDIVAKCANK